MPKPITATQQRHGVRRSELIRTVSFCRTSPAQMLLLLTVAPSGAAKLCTRRRKPTQVLVAS